MPREILRFDAGDDPPAGNPAPPSPSDGQAWPRPQYAPSYRLSAQPYGGPPRAAARWARAAPAPRAWPRRLIPGFRCDVVALSAACPAGHN
jgi:hypothetical protein